MLSKLIEWIYFKLNKPKNNIGSVPWAEFIEECEEFRIFAFRVDENGFYTDKLVIVAFPSYSDLRHEILGQLVVTIDTLTVEWLEVVKDQRLKGLGTRLWKAAEKILEKKIPHNPMTVEGLEFAKSMGYCPSSEEVKDISEKQLSDPNAKFIPWESIKKDLNI